MLSWALYDWANSSYFVIIQTFVFAAYFQRSIAADAITGTDQWGTMISLAGLVIALTAPLLGAIADKGGRRKPWILGFTILCVVACLLLWYAKPDEEYILFSLFMAFLATIGAEYVFLFYSAMLPDLVPPHRMGRWSGWGWSLGFAGGLVCLLVALYAFIETGGSWLNLDTSSSEHVRATFVLTAVWYTLFSLPMFFKTPDVAGNKLAWNTAVQEGFAQLKTTLAEAKKYKNIIRFLVARMIYNDGLALIFSFGGVYAAGTFDMDESQIIMFGVGLNVTAGLGAFGFAWMDDKSGSKKTIMWTLVGLTVPVLAILFVESVFWFWVWGLILGVFVGPIQAASRTLILRLSPEESRNQMYGLFALSGKATAFLGPKLIGIVTVLFASQRAGMTVIFVMLLIGFLLMFTVEDAPPVLAKSQKEIE
jgi:UMF1 family MFS transporter